MCSGLGQDPTLVIYAFSIDGANVLLLWEAGNERHYKLGTWLTYKQAQELGGFVKKGEKSVRVVYASSYTKKTEDKQTGQEVEERRNFLKSYRVFNVEQTEGLPAHLYHALEPKPFEDRRADVEAFINRLGAKIKHGGSRAAYNKARDLIRLPHPETFRDAHSYYYTHLHELGHWTGHESRLKREFSCRFGDRAYAFEELVAELTSAFVAARLGIHSKLEHASYLGPWLDILKADKGTIFTAARKAEEAAEYLFAQAEALERAA